MVRSRGFPVGDRAADVGVGPQRELRLAGQLGAGEQVDVYREAVGLDADVALERDATELLAGVARVLGEPEVGERDRDLVEPRIARPGLAARLGFPVWPSPGCAEC